MHQATKAEKDALAVQLQAYLQAGNKLTIRQYDRLTAWLAGQTINEIAEREGTSRQAVGHSVRRDSGKIKTFAQSKDNQ